MGVLEDKTSKVYATAFEGETDALSLYRNYKKLNKTFIVRFARADKDGNMTCYSGGVRLVLPLKETVWPGKDEELQWVRSRFLQHSFDCKVKEIDEKGQTVILQSASVLSVLGRSGRKLSEAEEELNERVVRKGEQVPLPAKITRVSRYGVAVNLLGERIPGYVGIRDWKPTFTTDLVSEALDMVGEWIEVLVTGYDVNRKQWSCSRAALMEDPWEHIEEEFAKDDVLIVKAVHLEPEKGFFYGSICSQLPSHADAAKEEETSESDMGAAERRRVYDGLEVLVDYPTADRSLRFIKEIVLGNYYLCKVKVVSKGQHMFKAVAFDRAIVQD